MTGRGSTVRSAHVTVYAARFEGREGWELGEAIGDLDAAFCRLAARGEALRDIRALGSATIFDRDGTGFGPSGCDVGIALRHGWARDEAAGCWRAPGEPITAPATTPVRTEALAVTFAPPIHGWIRVTISHREAEVRIAFSNVFPPIADMLAFLEQVAAGGYPRLVIDEEGRISEWHCFAAVASSAEDLAACNAGALVRFAILSDVEESRASRARQSPAIDVVISRTALVRQVYCAWLQVALGDPARLARDWLHDVLEERDRPEHPDGHLIPTDEDLRELRSAVLDRAFRR